MTAAATGARPGWGVLGTGLAARLMTADLVSSGHRVAAVASRTQDAAEAFADAHGIERAYGTYEALLSDEAVDIVYVATPHSSHAEHASAALRHGKHVLVEKAFTLNRAEAASIAELAAACGLMVMEAMWTRFLPHMDFVRSAVRRGDIGDVTHVRAVHAQALPTDGAHRLNRPDLGGGALLDLGVYPVSFVHDLLGAPTAVEAHAEFTDTGVDSEISIRFEYSGGAVAEGYASSRRAADNSAVVTGTEGTIRIDSVFYQASRVTVVDGRGREISHFDRSVPGRGMQFQAAEMERAIADGDDDSPLMPIAQSVEIMGVLDAVRERIGLRYPQEA